MAQQSRLMLIAWYKSELLTCCWTSLDKFTNSGFVLNSLGHVLGVEQSHAVWDPHHDEAMVVLAMVVLMIMGMVLAVGIQQYWPWSWS